MPNLSRPRLSTATEERFAEVDRRDAAKYASMETLTHKFCQLADELEADDEAERAAAITPPAGTVVEKWEEEDSMVHNIEDVRAKLVR
jgi:hypothetical protein